MEGISGKTNGSKCFYAANDFCFKKVVDEQKQSLIVINRLYQVLYGNLKASEEFKRICGKTIETGISIYDILVPEHLDKFKQYLQKAFDGESNIDTFRFTDLQQNEIWFESNFYPIIQQNGSIETIIINSNEITSLKQALCQTQENEKRFKSIVQNQPELICRYYPNGTILFVNNAYSDFFGKPEVELIGQNWFNLMPEFIRESAIKEINSLCIEKPHNTYSQVVMDAKANKRWLLATDCALFDENGLVREIQSIGKDITELKLLEIQLERSNKRLEATLKAIPDLVFLTDGLGNIVDSFASDPSRSQILTQDVLGRNVSNFLTQDVADRVKQTIIQCLSDNEIHSIEFEKDVEGEKNYFESRLVKAENQRVLSICRNITQRKMFEMELIDAKEKAEESDRLKIAFLTNISHEIRTPMNGIMGFSRLLLDPEIKASEISNFSTIIYSSCRRLLSVINDIVDISKIMTSHLVPEKTNLELTSLLSEMKELFQSVALLNGLELFTFPDPFYDNLSVSIDGNMLKQVLSNLLSNAIKYSENNKVNFGYLVKENQIEFYVEDKGTGIPKDSHKMIFERFKKLENPKKNYEGTGLGLAIAKSLVEIMDGQIWVESEPGKGSKFIFSLPFVQVEPVPSSGNNILPISHYHNKWEGKTILVVEDEEINFQFINELLKKTGAKVVRAEDGEAAITYTQLCAPSIILMDIKMPKINGLNATKIIRASLPILPIIALTAYSSENDKTTALAAGCSDYITKPFLYGELLNIISDYIDANKK